MDRRLPGRYKSVRGADAYAQQYRKGWMRQLSNWREHQVVAQALLACGTGRTVLNIPCGTGRLGELLQAQGFQVVGSDISLPMFHHTPQLCTWPPVTGSALQLPFRTASFDGVFMMRLLHHLADPHERQSQFREVARVSRNRVLMTFADYQTLENLIREWCVRWVKDCKPKITLMSEQLRSETEACGLRLTNVYRLAPLFTPLALALCRKD